MAGERRPALDVAVPPAIVVCCDLWSVWHRSLSAKRPEEPQVRE
jgi:hypothetical protein